MFFGITSNRSMYTQGEFGGVLRNWFNLMAKHPLIEAKRHYKLVHRGIKGVMGESLGCYGGIIGGHVVIDASWGHYWGHGGFNGGIGGIIRASNGLMGATGFKCDVMGAYSCVMGVMVESFGVRVHN